MCVWHSAPASASDLSDFIINVKKAFCGRRGGGRLSELDTLNVLSYRTAIGAAKTGDRAKNGGYNDGGETWGENGSKGRHQGQGLKSWNSADVLTTSPMMGDDPVSVAIPGSGCKSLGYDVKASAF